MNNERVTVTVFLACITTSLMTIMLVMALTNSFANGQSTNETITIKYNDPSVEYAQTARNLLNQVMVEYQKGNTTGANDLATSAYLDNFEYVEAPLDKNGASDLKEAIEDPMREELREKIQNKVSPEELASHVKMLDDKLKEAILILNKTSN
jgi:hypothetical protein